MFGTGAVALAGCTSLPPSAPDPLGARIDAHFAPLAATRDVSGVLRVERPGKPPLERSWGYADWQGRFRHTGETRFSAASVTKGVTAAALVALVRAGNMMLTDPVSRWMPALAAFPAMSLEAVLSHRAGLPRDFPDDYDPVRASASAWLAANRAGVGPVGEESYSNVGYGLLAEVIAASTGRAFADVVGELVVAPAGMTASAVLPGIAADAVGGALPYTAGPAPQLVETPVPAPLEFGSSGLVTTASDLIRWARALADGAWPELFAPDDPFGSIDRGTDAGGEYVSIQGTLPGYSANAIAWRGGPAVAYAGNLFSFPVLDMGRTLRALVAGEGPPVPAMRPADVPLGAEHRSLAGEHMAEGFGRIAIRLDASGRGMRLTFPERAAYWSFYLTPMAGGALHWRAFDRILSRGADGTLVLVER
ncbi:hypothetical protein AAW00_07415 [Aurantiacibacter luteus]|uniref:Beta-lactamase-related domain-containing protein n=2 Tax=Aurantiacibacter luteus TaxID=1581420 RepID=A0A0G9MTM3_9SPHN|nr:hypothetical protein AAW00_07415 [Aurantiacibacter luteus]